MKAKMSEPWWKNPVFRVRALKIGGSVLIVYHLLAVFWAPFRFATGAGSPFANYPDTYVFEWYYQPLYLDHGYAFFAPNPGPTHVVDFRVFDQDGEIIAEGRFPDRQEHLPRLRYHRYFMLSENLNQISIAPEEIDLATNDLERKALARRRANYVMLKTAIEEGLTRKYGGDHAVVDRVEHRSPTPQEFWDGWKLTDPRLFQRLSENLPKEVLPK